MNKKELFYLAFLAFIFSLALNYTIFDLKNTSRFTTFIDKTVRLNYGMTRENLKDYLGEPSIETETMMIWKFDDDPVEVAIDGEYYQFMVVLKDNRLVGIQGGFK